VKIKTSELIGLSLDWAVAKCEGLIDSGKVGLYMPREYCEYSSPLGWSPERQVYYDNDYRPTRDWSIGGPIIERERIEVRPTTVNIDDTTKNWSSSIADVWMFMPGHTPLISSMRCYVASKLGDEVDIPDELVNSLTKLS
jgi:hypothetical protein